MLNDQWRRVEELFHAGLELPRDKREAFLKHECGDDLDLLTEVASLIAELERGNTFIDEPAVNLSFKLLSSQTSGSLVGRVLGHFRILKLLGAGGMGEVYLAEDTVLERQVALKFLATGFGDDVWAKTQLIREAKAIAQLENPNICAIHRIEEIDGFQFIEMQYVEGESLQTCLKVGPLELDRALSFAEQISGALAAAHSRGIIHRDIKTQNIIVTPTDQIKVLDFGLAKLINLPTVPENQLNSDLTSSNGIVIGTVAYMSPEQSRGESLDPPTDVFSFGIVLSEMVSGVNPFLRETKEKTQEAIQLEEPELDSQLPPQLLQIIRGCLDKDRVTRFENAEQVRSKLRELIKSRQPKDLPVWLERKRIKYYALAAAMLLVMVLAGSGFVYRRVSSVHTLALIQIKNQSGDGELSYLSQGLTRNLFDKFSYLPRVRVKQSNEIPTRTDRTVDFVRAGRDLKVESVLMGEVIKQDQKVVLRIKLFSTSDGSVLWEESFNTSDTSLFDLQDEITSKVVSNLGMWLIGSDSRRLAKHQTNSEEALRHYMFGRQFLAQRDEVTIKKALDSFEKAVAIDPAFAEAYAGLSDCYVVMNTVAYGELSTSEAMSKARWNARQAIQLNDSLADAHVSLGVIALRYLWDWQTAENEFRRAIQIDPNNASAYYSYSQFLSAQGRYDEALKQSDLARQLDPYSTVARFNYGRALYYARRTEDALNEFNNLVQENPNNRQYLHLKGLVEIQAQQYSLAVETLESLYNRNPLHAAAALGYAFGKMGRQADAERILKLLDETTAKRNVPSLEKALVYIGLGDKDKAFSQLDLAVKERFASMAFINADSLYDDLRSDQRYKELIERIGLPVK